MTLNPKRCRATACHRTPQLPWTAHSQGLGEYLKNRRKTAAEFSINFQPYFSVLLSWSDTHLLRQAMTNFIHREMRAEIKAWRVSQNLKWSKVADRDHVKLSVRQLCVRSDLHTATKVTSISYA